MAAKGRKTSEPHDLRELLEATDERTRSLFIKVMNLHAGYQIEERSKKQLMEAVRKEAEKLSVESDYVDEDVRE